LAANAKFKFRRVFGLPQQRAFFACKQTPRTYSNPGQCIADRLVEDPVAAAASHSQPQLNQSRPFGCRPYRFRSRGPQSVSQCLTDFRPLVQRPGTECNRPFPSCRASSQTYFPPLKEANTTIYFLYPLHLFTLARMETGQAPQIETTLPHQPRLLKAAQARTEILPVPMIYQWLSRMP
jgi:hypothetical protein